MSKKKKIKKQEKQKIIQELQKDKDDTGSTVIQIGLLTKDIKDIAQHLKKHIHDFSSRRGLLKKVSQRRKLLKYLEVHDPKKHEAMIKKIKS